MSTWTTQALEKCNHSIAHRLIQAEHRLREYDESGYECDKLYRLYEVHDWLLERMKR